MPTKVFKTTETHPSVRQRVTAPREPPGTQTRVVRARSSTTCARVLFPDPSPSPQPSLAALLVPRGWPQKTGPGKTRPGLPGSPGVQAVRPSVAGDQPEITSHELSRLHSASRGGAAASICGTSTPRGAPVGRWRVWKAVSIVRAWTLARCCSRFHRLRTA